MKSPNAKEISFGKMKDVHIALQKMLDDAMLSQAEAADLLDLDHRTMRRYVLQETKIPYTVFYAIEMLVHFQNEKQPKLSQLRKMKREELEALLARWREKQKGQAGASKEYQRAESAIHLIYTELKRRADKRASNGA